MRGPTARRRCATVAVAGFSAAVSLAVAGTAHRTPEPGLAPAPSEIFASSASLCAGVESTGLITEVETVDRAMTSDLRRHGGVALTVAFLRRMAARPATPPALASRVRAFAGARARAARTGDFEVARQLAAEAEGLLAEACT